MLRAIISGLLLFALAACATPSVDKAYRPGEGTGKGVLVGSITRLVDAPSGYRVLYTALSKGKFGYIEFGGGMVPFALSKGNLDVVGLRGNVFAVELPAGQYTIYSWQVKSGYATITASQPFSAKFEIQPGKIVYVGSFAFEDTDKFGLTITGAKVTWSDQKERDLAVFKAKYTEMASLPVSAAIQAGANYPDLGGAGSTTWQIPVIVPVY